MPALVLRTFTNDLSALLTPVLADVGYGGYVSWWKALIFVVFFLIWAKLLAWLDKDLVAARFPREIINSSAWGALVLATALFFFLPNFLIAFGAFLVIFLASVGAYLGYRNSKVGVADLKEDFQLWAANLFKSKNEKRSTTKEESVLAGMITIFDKNGRAIEMPEAEPESEERIGYEGIYKLLVDPLYRRAEQISLQPAGETAQLRFVTDGYPYAGETMDRAEAVATVKYLKEITGLDPSDVRRIQKGKLKVRTAKSAHEIEIVTSGTTRGESLVMEVDPTTRYRDRATALGFTSSQKSALEEVLSDNSGIVLAGAPKGGGMSALMYGLALEHDAFTQHIHSIEFGSRDRELEGVTQNILSPHVTADEEADKVQWIASQLPDVVIAMTLLHRPAARVVTQLVRENENKRVYIGLRGGETAEIITRWKQLVGDPAMALRDVRLVIAGRVMRRLCDACKVGYAPDAKTLRLMGQPKEKVRELYKARTEPMIDPKGNPIVCEFCDGLGYKGRIGAFEVLPLDDEARKALVKDSSSSTVKSLLRKQKQLTLQEAALRAVIAGRTSMQEVLRALRSGEEANASRRSRSSSSGATTPSSAAATPTSAAGA